jgi:ATP-dependent helicase/nuclease subunit B
MQKKEWDFVLDDGWVVLTINRRLSRYVERCYEQQKHLEGHIIWPTPDILPFSAWLERCWDYLLDEAVLSTSLLSEDQERILWEKVVAHSQQKGSLLWSDSAAHGAGQAWNLLASWSLEPPESEALGNEDASAFCRWADDFAKKCREKGWIPRGKMLELLTLHLDKIPRPKGVILAGFDEIIPSQKKLFSRLETFGIPVILWEEKQLSSTVVRSTFPDREAEIMAAALWSRGLVEKLPTGQKEANIAVVVPDLQALRSQIIRIFSEVFYPGRPQQAPFPDQSIFNLSLGASLAEFPMIRDGLMLLELARGDQDWQVSGSLLASPYWGGGESEWSQRGLLDARLRRQGALSISMADLIREGEGSCPILSARLSLGQEFLTAEKLGDGIQKSPGEWACWFDKFLKILDWPGERSLSSHEYQAMESWRGVLGSFSALEKVLLSVGLDGALVQLEKLVTKTIFQPIESEAQVQILGVLEAEGEQFDALWILGLSDQAWPTIFKPNPFIPMAFQRKHNLPHSSNQRELQYAKRITSRLLGSANQVTVSYPEWEGEMQQRASPLITNIKEVVFEDLFLEIYPTAADSILKSQGMVFRNEQQPLPFPNSTQAVGGTSVIKSQALCPFSAFAKFRLVAQPLDEPTPGFNAAERGEITHAALSHFWQQVITSEKLDSMTFDERESLSYLAARKAVAAQDFKSGPSLSKSYLQLETARQKRLILNWLKVEGSRETHFEVIERESSDSIEIGGVVVNFRIDRVDRLATGGLVVVDYKTGMANPNSWFSDRPQEPQMLLYALAKAKELSALVYGQLRSGKQCYSGLANTGGILPGVELLENGRYNPDHLDWPTLLNYWSEVVNQLAAEYRQGKAAVDPLPNACDWCELSMLCRVSERLTPDRIVLPEMEGLS